MSDYLVGQNLTPDAWEKRCQELQRQADLLNELSEVTRDRDAAHAEIERLILRSAKWAELSEFMGWWEPEEIRSEIERLREETRLLRTRIGRLEYAEAEARALSRDAEENRG